MRAVLFVFLLLTNVARVNADEALPSGQGCLPPVHGNHDAPSDCDLTYRKPQLLRQDIIVDECHHLKTQVTSLRPSFMLISCSVYNNSEEPIESFRYGVKYSETGNSTVLAEAGFGNQHRLKTANISKSLLPGERRSLDFVGPTLPEEVDISNVEIAIEVLEAYVPGSRAAR